MQADKSKILQLLRTARGQMDGIIKMVEENRYCMDVSNQILASQAILTRANKEVLKQHIFNCVLNANGEQSKERLAEINSLLDKLL